MLARISMLRRLFCPTKIFAAFLSETAYSQLNPNKIRAGCWLRTCRCFND